MLVKTDDLMSSKYYGILAQNSVGSAIRSKPSSNKVKKKHDHLIL